MEKKVLLKDIAKKAKVSIATVSYVLSKKENSGVGIEVSEKVKKIAKELNYWPNQIAKSLQSGKTFTIGLIVADISNPFFANIARITEDEAKSNNYTVIFGSSDEKSSKSSELITFLLNRQVDGFIIAPAEGSEEQISNLKKQNIPFVLIDRYFPKIDTNYVAINNYNAAYDAVIRLVETGNKKVGIIAYSTTLHHIKERVRGYTSAMKDSGLFVKKCWTKEIEFSNLIVDVNDAIDSLLSGKQSVTAIFFATNTLAVHGLKRINELKLKVPNDVSIIVFDAGEVFDFFYCPLSHVMQPLAEIGKNAVRILIDQISNPNQKTKKISLNAKLIVRESCK